MKILMRLRPYGPLVLLGFNLVFGLASIWNVLRWHGKPIVRLIPFYVPISDTWVVGVPTPDWWPAISNAGMHRNDKLISIEGRSWNEHARVIDDQVAVGLKSVRVVFERLTDKSQHTVDLLILPYDWRAISDNLDGIGFDPVTRSAAQGQGHVGLLNIEDRAKMLGVR